MSVYDKVTLEQHLLISRKYGKQARFHRKRRRGLLIKVESAPLCGCETWKVTPSVLRKEENFTNKYVLIHAENELTLES